MTRATLAALVALGVHILAAPAAALVTCACPRFGSGAVFTTCRTSINLENIGQWATTYPAAPDYPSGEWPPATDTLALDLCGPAQNNSRQPERLHAFYILNPGYYRIETRHRSGREGLDDDYTVAMQLETGSTEGYYDGDGSFVDESKYRCAIGDVPSGRSKQAQMTVWLRKLWYVLLVEQTPQSANISDVYLLFTRVESTASPSRAPTPPTAAPTTLAPAVAGSPTNPPTDPAVAPLTSLTSPAATALPVFMLYLVVALFALFI